MRETVRRRLLGPPLPSDRESSERLSNPLALAVLSSDALSSVAYATEEMLKILVPVAGVAAYRLSLPIAGAVVVLLALLVLSYRQTIKAYPNAGGAYVVTKDNFGLVPAQVAGMALLLDYIMTVAVSISAAVAALYSYFPSLFPVRVGLSVACIWLVAWGNLRGVRAAGRTFAAPTYFFLASIASLLLAGLGAALSGRLHPLPPPPGLPMASTVPLLVLVHAYASGTTALTGVEAISNGVSVFRPVEWCNARRVLTWMGAILAVTFSGITLLAWRVHPVPNERRTVVSQLGEVVFGRTPVGKLGLLLLQVATTLILVLAANTSFADFPRLAGFAAGDGYLPRPLRRRGSRLVPSIGIIALAVIATGVVVGLGADVHRMIPFYALGVFAAFTFSQAGMTRRHLRLREPGWQHALVLNALGAAGSGLALAAVLVTKFTHGAWVVAVLLAAGLALSLAIHRHYRYADAWLAGPDAGRADWHGTQVVIGLPRPDGVLEVAARRYATRLQPSAGVDVKSVGGWPSARAAVEEIGRRAGPGCLTAVVVPGRTGRRFPPWSPVAPFLWRAARLENVAVTTLYVDPDRPRSGGRHACLVAVGRADGLARRGLAVARLLAADELHAVLVDVDPDETARAVARWEQAAPGVELRILPAPYRERAGPLRAEVHRLQQSGAEYVSVVVCTLRLRWWQRPLYLFDTDTIRQGLATAPGAAVVEHRLPLPRRWERGAALGLERFDEDHATLPT
ncbi:MAG: hypothetical protein QOJ23_5821 [Actinomycetota bacterium]|jgi:amino acid transporter|nr:hypothetical protein [Actinomycetota bacterium]